MHADQHLKVVKKTLRALDCLNIKSQVTVSELARWIKTPRTTAHRILETLVAEGYVAADRSARTTLYRLTDKVLNLSSGYDADKGLTTVAPPILNALQREVGWSVTLTTVSGDQVVVRYTTDRNAPLSILRSHAGARAPIVYTATGQVHLAFCDARERELILALARQSGDALQALAHQRAGLAAILARIRTDGYRVQEYDEYPEAGLAVPVFVHKRIVAGLVMRYVKRAIKRRALMDDYLPALRSAADQLARAYAELGGRKSQKA